MANSPANDERDTAEATHEGAYLHLMPHAGGSIPARWHVFRISDTSPRISSAATVSSWDEALKLAGKTKQPLHVAELAWQQMVTANVAPETVPAEAILV